MGDVTDGQFADSWIGNMEGIAVELQENNSAGYLLMLLLPGSACSVWQQHNNTPLPGHTDLLPFFFCKCIVSSSPSFENHKSVVCCTLSLQWRLMDCWIKAAESVCRREAATTGVGSQCTHSWCNVLFAGKLCSAPNLHAVKMQCCSFINARSNDYGSMQGYELCMGYALWYSVYPHP